MIPATAVVGCLLGVAPYYPAVIPWGQSAQSVAAACKLSASPSFGLSRSPLQECVRAKVLGLPACVC